MLFAPLLFAAVTAWSAELSPGCERFLLGVRQIPFRPSDQRAPSLRVAGADPDLRAFAIESAMTDYLITSRRIKAGLTGAAINPAAQFYDIIFIGAGPAELTAQLKLDQNPGPRPKTLTIEADEVIGRTFFATRAFYLNSTDGSSTSALRALPNRGLNLNKIPNGLIQTSDLQTSKYAEAGDFGDVINLNRLALPAPILFGERVAEFGPTRAPLRARGYPASTVRLASGALVYANVVVQTTGLGPERSTASSDTGRAFANDEWTNFIETGVTPKYFSAGRFFNFISNAQNPYAPFSGKRIVVIGAGDYAKVIWEFLERTGPPGAYRRDTAEVGRYLSGQWVAPNIDAQCASFVGTERSRYLRGIPAALQKGRIVGVPGVSFDVRSRGDEVELIYVTADGEKKTIVADVVIDAIGFERLKLTTESLSREVRADIPDTADAVIGIELYPGAYQAGVAANVPVTREELANVADNRVSLYLNLVRVDALIAAVNELYRESYGRFPALGPPTATPAEPGTAVAALVRLVNPKGRVQSRAYAKEFAEAQISGALAQFSLGGTFTAKVEIVAQRDENGAVVFRVEPPKVAGFGLAQSSTDLFVRYLTATPAFLSVLDERVDHERATRFTWTVQSAETQVRVTSDLAAEDRDDGNFTGERLTNFFGLRSAESLVFARAPSLPEAPTVEEFKDLRRPVARLPEPSATESFLKRARTSATKRRDEKAPTRVTAERRILLQVLGARYVADRAAVRRPFELNVVNARWVKICAEANITLDELRDSIKGCQSRSDVLRRGVRVPR